MDMKKCKGCGIVLQNEDEKKPGYVKKIGQEYCQRCFRLSHYGDLHNLHRRYVGNEEIRKIYEEYSSEVICLVIDILDVLFSDLKDLLSLFADKKLILVFSKTDVLPYDTDEEAMQKQLEKTVKSLRKTAPGILDVLLTSMRDQNFRSFFLECLDAHELKRVVFAGRANAGKSSIINRLIGEDSLSVSRYPGTTLGSVELHYEDYTFIDTPGLLDPDSVLSYLPVEKMEEVSLAKTLKPHNYQVYEPMSYFIEGLCRVDVEPEKDSTLVFFVNPLLDIHRTKYENADTYFERNRKDIKLKFDNYKTNPFSYKGSKTIYIKGLGVLRFVGKGKGKIHICDKMKWYESEVFI